MRGTTAGTAIEILHTCETAETQVPCRQTAAASPVAIRQGAAVGTGEIGWDWTSNPEIPGKPVASDIESPTRLSDAWRGPLVSRILVVALEVFVDPDDWSRSAPRIGDGLALNAECEIATPPGQVKISIVGGLCFERAGTRARVALRRDALGERCERVEAPRLG